MDPYIVFSDGAYGADSNGELHAYASREMAFESKFTSELRIIEKVDGCAGRLRIYAVVTSNQYGSHDNDKCECFFDNVYPTEKEAKEMCDKCACNKTVKVVEIHVQ